MAKPSQVIILAEDSRQQQLVWRYCRRCGLDAHELRLVPCPAGQGSGEQWVRERFAAEVQAYRNRRARAKTETKYCGYGQFLGQIFDSRASPSLCCYEERAQSHPKSA